MIDGEVLRLLLLNDTPHDQIADKYKVTTRSVRRQIERERAAHGPSWPMSSRPPATRQPKPSPAASLRGPAPGAAATADELEDYAQSVLVAETQAEDASTARIAAARALVEIADKRRARRPAGSETLVDPAEAAAAVMLEIERATANVTSADPAL